MESFFILSSTSGKAEILFDMIDIPLYCGSDLIGIIPFIGSTNGSWIGPQIFFGIDIYHAAAFGTGTRIAATTFAMRTLRGFIIVPYHFRTDKLESGNATFEFCSAFVFHRK